MSRIRGRDTKPEMRLRRALHAQGFRYRLHRRDLPGSPDIVLPKWKTAIFVHGCFWHRHTGCRKATTPTSNVEFWNAKFLANTLRDARVLAALHASGWKTAVVWECALDRGVTPEDLGALVDLMTENDTAHLELGAQSRQLTDPADAGSGGL